MTARFRSPDVFVISGLVPRVLALLRWPDGVGEQGQPLWTGPLP